MTLLKVLCLALLVQVTGILDVAWAEHDPTGPLPKNDSSRQSAPPAPDSTMLTGAGRNTLAWGIDRPVPGGVMRKDPGKSEWYFVRGLTDLELEESIRAHRRRLVEEHGDEPRDVLIDVEAASELALLQSRGLGGGASYPCTLAARLTYRVVAELVGAGISLRGANDPPVASRRERPQSRLREGADPGRRISMPPAPMLSVGELPQLAAAATNLLVEGFEASDLDSRYWTSGDLKPASGLDFWGQALYNCAYVHSGSGVADCAAYSDRPCFTYDNDMDAYLQNPAYFNTAGFESIDVSFWLKYSLETGYDYFAWYYSPGPSSGWVRDTILTGARDWAQWGRTVVNVNHGADYMAVKFALISDESNRNYAGAQVDDVIIRGQPPRPNLVATVPLGWSGSVVPSSVPNTVVYGPLYAAPEPTYCDVAVKNSGVVPSGAFNVDLYLDGLIFMSRTSVGALGAGQSVTLTDILNNSSIGAGSHFVEARIDASGQVDEIDENDNRAVTPTMTWSPARKDIVVELVTVTPSSPLVGQQVDVAVTLRSAGPADITTNFLVDFYRNRGAAPTLGTAGDQSQTVFQPFYAGTTRTLHFTETNGSPGSWSSYVFADRNGAVSESDESNNIPSAVPINWVSGYVAVSGRYTYDDSLAGQGRPMTCMKVRIYDEDPTTGAPGSTDDLLAETFTNATGDYGPIAVLNQDSDQPDNGLLDIYVVVEYTTSTLCRPTQGITVTDGTGAPWNARSSVVTNAQNGVCNMQTLQPLGSPRRRAAHIYHTLLRGYDWVLSRGSTPGAVSAEWFPGNDEYTAYSPSSQSIAVNGKVGLTSDERYCGPDEYDDFPLLHELGHHIAWSFGAAPLVANCSFGIGHVGCAMSEGWPDWFASQMVKSTPTPILRDWFQRTAAAADTGVRVRNLEDGTYATPDGMVEAWNNTGELEVGGVYSTLWDMSDAPADNQLPATCGDQMVDPVDRTWQASVNHPGVTIVSFCEFRNVYFKKYILGNAGAVAQFNNTMCEHGVGCGGVLDAPFSGSSAEMLAISSVWPNPTSGMSSVRLRLPLEVLGEPVVLEVYDVAGARIRTLFSGVGTESNVEVGWDGTSETGKACRSGMYFVRLSAGSQRASTTLVRLK